MAGGAHPAASGRVWRRGRLGRGACRVGIAACRPRGHAHGRGEHTVQGLQRDDQVSRHPAVNIRMETDYPF